MKKKNPLMVVAVILISSAGAFALIPAGVVHDPISNGGRMAEAAAQIAMWTQQIEQTALLIRQTHAQIQQFKKFSDYRTMIDGAWGVALERLPDNAAANICVAPVNIKAIGWGGEDEFQKVLGVTNGALTALDQLRGVMDARPNANIAVIRDDLEAVWGDVPVTRAGLAVSAAHREMASATVFAGGLNQAIAEKRANIKRILDEVNSGMLVPGDLERRMVILEAEKADVDLMLAQTVNQSNRIAIHQLGFDSNRAGSAEMNRLRERSNMLRMQSSVSFGMSLPSSTAKGVE